MIKTIGNIQSERGLVGGAVVPSGLVLPGVCVVASPEGADEPSVAEAGGAEVSSGALAGVADSSAWARVAGQGVAWNGFIVVGFSSSGKAGPRGRAAAEFGG